jgi:hypothetical protein
MLCETVDSKSCESITVSFGGLEDLGHDEKSVRRLRVIDRWDTNEPGRPFSLIAILAFYFDRTAVFH